MRVLARSSPWITSKLKKRIQNGNILKTKAIRSKGPFDSMQLKKSIIVNSKAILLSE